MRICELVEYSIEGMVYGVDRVNITSVCDIEIGKTPSRNNLEFWGKGNKWVSIRDMKGKYLLITTAQL